MPKIISARDLNSLLSSSDWSGRILHLLPEDHFQAVHLPGAHPACVFEVSFLDQVASAGATHDTPLILCSAGSLPFAAQAAADKLAAAGYQNVSILQGGLEAWK